MVVVVSDSDLLWSCYIDHTHVHSQYYASNLEYFRGFPVFERDCVNCPFAGVWRLDI